MQLTRGRVIALLLAGLGAMAGAWLWSGGARRDAAAPEIERLEQVHDSLARERRDIEAMIEAARADQAAGRLADAQATVDAVRQRQETLTSELARYQDELAVARERHPQDAVIEWLTGELLMSAGGEPREVLPYFSRAIAAGIKRAGVFASLARVQYELNDFETAYRSAAAALDIDVVNRDAWEVFGATGIATARFDDVLEKIESSFDAGVPDWLEPTQHRASELASAWAAEQDRRRAEEAVDDLPRVRLTIEHQTFDSGNGALPSTTPTPTGRGDVEIELFEDQAPEAVSSFLTLVETGFYNGTRFHWVRPAQFALGGDPNTKNGNPADDGTGGPGYVIADESSLPNARRHFRGTVSLYTPRPRQLGSQFLICIVTCTELDGRMTVLGRVVRGQDVVDRMTPGRTATREADLELTIPGDLIVRAEIIRKRAHPYTFRKLPS